MSKLAACPQCGADLTGDADGRAGFWRFRVRLYDMQRDENEPIADSDSDLPPDQPGATVVRGLWKVTSELAQAAQDFHGTPCVGMGAEDLERKVRGMRPTLSRRGGNATMRVQYDTPESFRPEPNRVPRYLARVDINKEVEAAHAS